MKDSIKSYNEFIFEDVLLEGKLEAISKCGNTPFEAKEVQILGNKTLKISSINRVGFLRPH